MKGTDAVTRQLFLLNFYRHPEDYILNIYRCLRVETLIQSINSTEKVNISPRSIIHIYYYYLDNPNFIKKRLVFNIIGYNM